MKRLHTCGQRGKGASEKKVASATPGSGALLCKMRVGWRLSAFFGCLLMSERVMATAEYTYENDNKTYVATVTSAETPISQAAIDVLNGNAVTNFVKRGDANLSIYSGGGDAFAGDVAIENGAIIVGGQNPLGTSGRITVCNQRVLTFSKGTVAKDVLLASEAWNQSTKISVWAGSSRLDGKLILGKTYNIGFTGYDGSVMTFAGGVEDEEGENATDGGYPYFTLSKGSSVVFEGTPVNIARALAFLADTSRPLASDGFAGRVIFSVAGNKMASLGSNWQNGDGHLSLCQLKTTVDNALYNGKDIDVFIGHDSVWDLCGTSQRINQISVKWTDGDGNPSVITNSLATPATLHMGMIYKRGSSTIPANIRYGGNLSVVFDKNIFRMLVNYENTATGDLIVNDAGTLEFQENGSWANAANVAVNSANGKITVANPNAFGRNTNLSLKSNSSLEIASGVTVRVRTLTIDGVQKPGGDYTFGSGTLSVLHPRGFVIRVH